MRMKKGKLQGEDGQLRVLVERIDEGRVDERRVEERWMEEEGE